MVRFDPAKSEGVMEKEGARPMEFTGRTMKGFVYVDENVLTTKKKLEYWIKLALEYNKIAKASKKKPPKKKK
jgi:TfoX/Sxy family transcriptional regulator of competence genes